MSRQAICLPCPDFDIRLISEREAAGFEVFHLHHSFEIAYQLAGARRYAVENTTCLVNAGSLTVVGPERAHYTAPAVGEGQPYRYIQLHFTGDYLKDVGAVFPQLDLTAFLTGAQPRPLNSLNARQQAGIQALLEQLLQLQGRAAPRAQAMCVLLLACLLLYLQDLYEVQPAAGTGRLRTLYLVENVQAYIAAHYAEALSLQSIADKFFVSACYLSRVFKQVTHLGVAESVNAVRIRAAQAMLGDPAQAKLTVGEVAQRCGFGTTAHFRRVFREAVGMSPRQYRAVKAAQPSATG